jgi:ribosomal protein L7/L12
MNFVGLEDQVRALLAQGRKVEAVKRVYKTTGWGLKESKDYVDALVDAAPPAPRAVEQSMD